MKKLNLVVLVILSIGLMLLLIQNTALIRANFLWLSVEVPAIVLLLLTAVGGFVMGLLVRILLKDVKNTKLKGENNG